MRTLFLAFLHKMPDAARKRQVLSLGTIWLDQQRRKETLIN